MHSYPIRAVGVSDAHNSNHPGIHNRTPTRKLCVSKNKCKALSQKGRRGVLFSWLSEFIFCSKGSVLNTQATRHKHGHLKAVTYRKPSKNQPRPTTVPAGASISEPLTKLGVSLTAFLGSAGLAKGSYSAKRGLLQELYTDF